MINTFFFNMNAIKSGPERARRTCSRYKPRKVGILGAGMMGAGIAYVAGQPGHRTRCWKDVSLENAQRGKSYSFKLTQARVDKGRMSPLRPARELLDHITAHRPPRRSARAAT